MTELEKKAEEYAKNKILILGRYNTDLQQAYKDGYKQGQKDFDTDVTKLLNNYGVTFIDTNSIGGLIALHQLILDLEKENEELKEKLKNEIAFNEQSETVKKYKAQIGKMKTFSNCKNWRETQGNGYCICDKWELAE